MASNRFLERTCAGIAAIALAFFTLDCGSNTPTTPGGNGAVTSVTVSTTSLAAGATAVVTVTLATTYTAVTNVALTSNNTAAVSVPSSLTIAAGATTASTTVTAIAPGTAVIFAAADGSSAQSASITVTAAVGAVLKTLTLSASTVVGGQTVTATIGLSAPAGSSGAAVALTGGDPLVIPATITVPAGFMSTTFVVTTRAVGGTILATIGGSFGGGQASASLSVTRPMIATAVFGVTGPSETETCDLQNNGSTIDCTFNGSPSTAPGNIVEWDWTYGVSTMVTKTTTGPMLSMPATSCALLPPPPLASGTTFLTMTVTLVVKDDQGNVSVQAVDNGVRLFPQGSCGY